MRQPNRTRSALLGFLTWGPMSGYDLRKLIDGSISNFWSESYGRIYPMLAQLVEDKLAERSEGESEGGRPRHTYAITDRGRAEFDAWLQEPVALRPPRNELLLKLFFGARGAPGAARRMIEASRDQVEDTLERFAEIRARLEAAVNPPPDRAFWLMTLRYGELVDRAQLEWCHEVLAELGEDPTNPQDGSP
jgi:PadR family transcriptional regulator AphA